MEPYLRLEADVARWMDLQPENVVVCSSGTAALHLAFEAMQLPRGSEVIVPDFTMVACARAVVLAGLVPKFVDCDDRLQLNLSLLGEQLWLKRGEPKAVLAVHMYGRQIDMEVLHRQAANLLVVEDMAELHGYRPHVRSSAACWSFYQNKVVGGEEGGAVWFADKHHAQLARKLRSLGFTDAHDFMHVPRGCNYRLSNANAQLVQASLDLFKVNMSWRRSTEAWYDEFCPVEWRMPERQSPWVYDVRIPGMSRDQQNATVALLRYSGIQARHAFKPMSLQLEFSAAGCRNPEAELASQEVLYLPISLGITKQQCERSFQFLRTILMHRSPRRET